MPDALQFYQRLQGVFPKETATVVAEVLHEALEDVRARDLQDLRGFVRDLAEAQKRTEARVGELAEAQKRTEARVGELAEAQKRTEARVEELAEAQKRTEARVEELAAALTQLAKVVADLVPRVGAAEGDMFELRFRDRLPAYLGRYLRRAKLLGEDEILDLVEDRLSEEEWHDVLLSDAVARGKRSGQTVYIVCEVSVTAGAGDLDRAARRAALLAKAGVEVRALVACRRIADLDAARARESGIDLWIDGRMDPVAAGH